MTVPRVQQVQQVRLGMMVLRVQQVQRVQRVQRVRMETTGPQASRAFISILPGLMTRGSSSWVCHRVK